MVTFFEDQNFCYAVNDTRHFFLGLNNCDDVLAIYIGDDRTDEDAFKVHNIIHSNIVCYDAMPQVACFFHLFPS